MKPVLAGAAAVALLLSAPALAAGLDAPPAQSSASAGLPALQVAVTKHAGVFNGQKLTYTATVAEYLVDGGDGKPGAKIVTIAYARDAKSPVQASRDVHLQRRSRRLVLAAAHERSGTDA
jgi:carboxypeptidase C (cathepsin A)